MPCDKCSHAQCATDKCIHFKGKRALPRDRAALEALSGHPAQGLPSIVATPDLISGQGLHCLYRCFIVAFKKCGGVGTTPSIAELRARLAAFVADPKNAVVQMDPHAANSETFAQAVSREFPGTKPDEYAARMREMTPGKTNMGGAIDAYAFVHVYRHVHLRTYGERGNETPIGVKATFNPLGSYRTSAPGPPVCLRWHAFHYRTLSIDAPLSLSAATIR